MTDEVLQLHQWIDDHGSDLVESLQGVLRIPSKKEPAVGASAPYGAPVREALDYTLALSDSLGFRTKDVDGHAGHAEFGEGGEMVAALGHLDIVPEGDLTRWESDPFAAEIRGGYIYARGASDDKGPTYAALFAAKAIMESGLPIRRRIRLIFGCDEESGFGCVHHYWGVANEERPVAGFTPDGDFPLVYAEKGIANITVSRQIERTEGLHVVSASGGVRTNMVPDSAEATLSGPNVELDRAVTTLLEGWDKNVTAARVGDRVLVRAAGKSAHGSTPHKGDNAVVRLARALHGVGLEADADWLEWILLSADTGGSGLGIEGHDDVAGPLTSNLGIFSASDGKVNLTYNVRYPVTWEEDVLPTRARAAAAGWTVDEISDSRPLYVPLDQEPVATLLRVYREETGDLLTQPKTMGGGTYARATPNVVAFGAGYPDDLDGPAHEPNERIGIESLIRSCKIYAHALYELAR